MERNNAIDIAKGIGIILMVIGHMTGMIPIHKFIYQFHMPMFLLFSGYFFNPEKWKHFSTFANQRFKQLIIPYICFSIIILWSITLPPSNSHISTYIYQGPPHAVWFLLILFFAEMLFWGLYKINHNKHIIYIYILLLIAIGQCLYLSDINLPYSLSSVPVCTAFYAIGFIGKKHLNKLIYPNHMQAISYALISLSLIYIYVLITGYHTELAGNHIEITGYITALLGTTGIINLSTLIDKKIPKFRGGGIKLDWKKLYPLYWIKYHNY